MATFDCNHNIKPTPLSTSCSLAAEEVPTIDHSSEVTDENLPVTRIQNDSRSRARKELTGIFRQLRQLLIDRQNVYGRCTIAGSESDSPKREDVLTEQGPASLEVGIQARKEFIRSLCTLTNCRYEKINKDFHTRPLLKPYDLQTSKEMTRSKNADFASTLMDRWANRCVDNIRGITFGIFDCIFVIYGKVMEPMFFSRFIVEWTLIYLQGRFAKLWKLQTTLLFCIATNQNEKPIHTEEDIFPFVPGYLSGGSFYKFMRKCMRPGSRKLVPFFYSIMQTKRNTVSLSWVDELKSLEKHRKNMEGAAFGGTVPEVFYDVVDADTWEVESKLCHPIGALNATTLAANLKIDLIVDEAFKHKPRDKKISLRYRPPSINSSFSHSRAKCGTQGWFSDFFWDLTPVFAGYLEEGWKPIPIYVPACLLYDLPEYELHLRQLNLDSIGSDFVQTDAMIHTVLEPLKARIITSGSAPLYHEGRMAQKIIHRAFRRVRYLELMGKPHTAEFFEERFRGRVLKKDWFWVAGDYDAATDGMNPGCSLHFCEAVGRRIGMSEEEILRYKSTMCGHRIHYPVWTSLSEMIQRWAQVMGSPGSFPSLCATNLAGFWVSVEIYKGYKVKFSELTEFCVEINGDDIVFMADERLYSIWKQVMTELGLTPSIGKNFKADDWMMVNSTCYWVDYQKPLGMADWLEGDPRWDDVTDEMMDAEFALTRLVEVGDRVVSGIRNMDHIDPGLIAGISKVQSDTRLEDMSELDRDAQLFAMCDKIRKACEGKSEEIVERMVECFHYHCGDRLRESKRSWTLPTTLGGLGLHGDCNKSTKLQKLVALKVAGVSIFPNFDKLVPMERSIGFENSLFVQHGDGRGPDGVIDDYPYWPDSVVEHKVPNWERSKILSYLKLDRPQTECGDAKPAYELPNHLRNDRTRDYLGYTVPDFSHLELSKNRKLTEGAEFDRCLDKAARSVDGISLDFLDKLDFNLLKDFHFENNESLVKIRPSFKYRLDWDPEGSVALEKEIFDTPKEICRDIIQVETNHGTASQEVVSVELLFRSEARLYDGRVSPDGRIWTPRNLAEEWSDARLLYPPINIKEKYYDATMNRWKRWSASID